jgi:hypothetical protein
MGGIGGGWMAGWMIAARFLVIRSKTPNVLLTGAVRRPVE